MRPQDCELKEWDRCRCGNRVPVGALAQGRCVACVREAKEKRAAEADRQHLAELHARYLSGHPFYAHMPREEDE